MCVAQFREYCKSFSFKRKETVKYNEEVMANKGSFYNNGWVMLYVRDNRKIRMLDKQGNPYAVEELKN